MKPLILLLTLAAAAAADGPGVILDRKSVV